MPVRKEKGRKRAPQKTARQDVGVSPDSQLWKERLGFVSGIILVWSLLLINLFPLAAGLQTRHHGTYNLFTYKYTPEAVLYLVLLGLLGLGLSAFTLAVVHIFARGMWLAGREENNASSAARKTQGKQLAAVCEQTYAAVFWATQFLLLSLMFLGVVSFVTLVFGPIVSSLFSVSKPGAFIIPILSISFFIVITIMIIATLRISGVTKNLLPAILRSIVAFIRTLATPPTRLSARTRLLCLCLFVVCPNGVGVVAYTADLEVSREVVFQSKNDSVEFRVRLGGATSAPEWADVRLRKPDGSLVRLELESVGGGSFVAYKRASSLSQGRYVVLLEYPRFDINAIAPFFHPKVRRSQAFLVAL